MARQSNKYLYLWVVKRNYGFYGWNDLTASEIWKEAKIDAKAYCENQNIPIRHTKCREMKIAE